MTLLWLLAACAPAASFRPPAATLADCELEASPQLRTLCLVQLGADLGRGGDGPAAEAACAAIPTELWNQECHFRSGEELAKAGRLAEGLDMCQKAGKFRTFCFTHAIWGVPATPEPLVEWEALGAGWEDVNGVSSLRARWWFNHTFGTGHANSKDIIAANTDNAAHARGAWALEAVRLAAGDLNAARSAWSGAPLQGEPLAQPLRVGRYDLPFAIEAEAGLPHVPTFGGSSRLVGETEEEDLDIALLEGAWFRESTTSDAFAAAMSDPRPRVRYTALRFFRALPSPTAEATISALGADPDPIVRAHVADALTYRTWLGKGKGGPTSAPSQAP